MYCYDPVYDLACAAASSDTTDRRDGFASEVRSSTNGKREVPFRTHAGCCIARLPRAGHRRARSARGTRLRAGRTRAFLHRARPRDEPRLPGLLPPALLRGRRHPPVRAALCDRRRLGARDAVALVPATSPSGALALRALARHGYRAVLATGRSLDEVRERCRAYRLAGGVAEYSAAVYNYLDDRASTLLDEHEIAMLEELRGALSQLPGVHEPVPREQHPGAPDRLERGPARAGRRDDRSRRSPSGTLTAYGRGGRLANRLRSRSDRQGARYCGLAAELDRVVTRPSARLLSPWATRSRSTDARTRRAARRTVERRARPPRSTRGDLRAVEHVAVPGAPRRRSPARSRSPR